MQIFVSAGLLPTISMAEPGAHGAAIAGTHGCGANTPIAAAAAVAAATVGFDGALYIPKGIMFTMGMLSIIVATGILSTIIPSLGGTTNVEGAIPKLHCKIK